MWKIYDTFGNWKADDKFSWKIRLCLIWKPALVFFWTIRTSFFQWISNSWSHDALPEVLCATFELIFCWRFIAIFFSSLRLKFKLRLNCWSFSVRIRGHMEYIILEVNYLIKFYFIMRNNSKGLEKFFFGPPFF